MFHKNRLLADDSHEISCLIFSKIRKNITKFVVRCSCDWRFKGKTMQYATKTAQYLIGCKMRKCKSKIMAKILTSIKSMEAAILNI